MKKLSNEHYACPTCNALFVVDGEVDDEFTAPVCVEHGGPDKAVKTKPISKVIFDKAVDKAMADLAKDAPEIVYEPAPEPDPVPEDPEPVDPETNPVEAEQGMATYADETPEGDRVVDSNDGIERDASRFLFVPPAPEQTIEPDPIVDPEASA